MLVSIIIPTFNSEEYIEECIEHIKKLNYPEEEIECIVIDNGSVDNTVSIAKKNNIKVIINKNVNVSQLRNIGAAIAKGNILCFIDSDVLVDKEWLKEGLNILKEENVGISGGIYGIPEKPSWIEKVWFESKNNIDGDVSFISAGTMLIKKELFINVDGFDDNMITGEDYDLCQKIKQKGFRVYRSNKIKSIHLGNPKTLYDVYKKERWYGLGMIDTFKYNKISKPLFLSVVNIILIAGVLGTIFVNTYLSLFLLLAVLFLPIIMSLLFMKKFKNLNMYNFLIFIPISFIYINSRSISLFEYFSIKKRGKKR